MPVAPQPVLAATGGPHKPPLAARLFSVKRDLRGLVVGFLVAPFFIVLHEGGHFATAKLLHIRAELHYAATTVHYDRLPPPPADRVVTAGGPIVQALVGGVGLLWLYRRRRTRLADPATWVDWLATWTALNGARWLAAWVPASISATRLKDEVQLLTAAGVPIWVGLALLGLPAFALFFATVRLHARGMRMVPFVYAFQGGSAGLNFWLRWLGPRLLP